ncbi:MAG: hypothetical protein OEY81_00250 [Candidatus Bathyarchaeota archaeon]|nr:hypothetical protein [Candidatus Bathyarchaeota archaeon]
MSGLAESADIDPVVNVTISCFDINGDPLYLASTVILNPVSHYGISGFTNSSGVFEATDLTLPETVDICVSWGNASAPGQPGYYIYFSGISATSLDGFVVNAGDLRGEGKLANVTLTLQNSTESPMLDTRLYMGFNVTGGVGFPLGMGPITGSDGKVTLYLSNDTWAPDPTYYTFVICQMMPANNTLLILTDRLVSSDEESPITMPNSSEMANVDLAFSSPSGVSLMNDIRLYFEFAGVPPDVDRNDLALIYLPSNLEGKMLFAVPLGPGGAFFLPVEDDGTTWLCLNASVPFQVAAIFTNTTAVSGGPWIYIPMNIFDPISAGAVEYVSVGGSYLKLRSVTPREAYLGSTPKLEANFTDEYYNPLIWIAGSGSTSIPTGATGLLSYFAVYNLTISRPDDSVWYDGQASVQQPYGGSNLNGILSGIPPFPSLDTLGTHTFNVSIDTGPWPLNPPGSTSEPLQGSFDVIEPPALATFNLDKNLNVWTEEDTLPSGNYMSNVNFGMGINNQDDYSDTTLGDLNFYTEAENINGVGWQEHAEWTSSYANWTFPPEFLLRENEGFGVGFNVDHYEEVQLNMTLTRELNATTFSSDGYQLANFTVNFTSTDFQGSWGNIGANEQWAVNASIVPGTFWTDASLEGFGEWMHGVNFKLPNDLIATGVVYNFSVIVKIELKGNAAPPILYKPGFDIGYGVSQESRSGGEGYTATMPLDMLPAYVTAAQVSTNTSNIWTLQRNDQVGGSLGEAMQLPGARATFGLDKNLNVGTEEDTLPSGNYMSNVNFGMNIYNEDDESDTTLGDLRFNATAMNINGVNPQEHVEWTSSYANWVFPPEFFIPENQGFGTGFGIEQQEMVDLKLTLGRDMNQTAFGSDGYQLANFTVNFTNTDFLGCGFSISANEHWMVNASIVPGTFWTDAPLEGFNMEMHKVDFSLGKEELQVGVEYNFSVVVRVQLTGNAAPPILYKPGFNVGYTTYQESMPGGEGYVADMPPEKLPDYVTVAQASTNISNIWTLVRTNNTGAGLGEVPQLAGARATFTLSKNLNVWTEEDTLLSGNYMSNVNFGMNIYNEDDESDTTLGDLRFNATAMNIIGVNPQEHVEWTSSYANWTFPPEFFIPENQDFWANFHTDQSEDFQLNMTLTRELNATTFSSDGYQLANFTVNFTNTDFLWSWGDINANERWEVNASIVPGTFQTDAPLEGWGEDMHWVHFNLRKDLIQAGVTYNFSVIIKVELTGNVAPPIIYKAGFHVGQVTSQQEADGGEGYTAEMPPDMLPSYVTSAQVSTNTSNIWTLERRNQVDANLNEFATDVLDLSDFPSPFTANTRIIIPISDPHGPCGAAHTMDTMGGILIANRLGREGGIVSTAMDSYSYISTYDFGTAKVTMTDTTSNLIVLASPGVNQVAYYYNELSVDETRVLPVLFLRDGLGDYLRVQSSMYEYRIERDGEGRVTAEYGVIQIYQDGERWVLLVYGLGGESSMATAKVVSEFDQWGLTGHAVIVKYYDSNADGYLDTIQIVETVP